MVAHKLQRMSSKYITSLELKNKASQQKFLATFSIHDSKHFIALPSGCSHNSSECTRLTIVWLKVLQPGKMYQTVIRANIPSKPSPMVALCSSWPCIRIICAHRIQFLKIDLGLCCSHESGQTQPMLSCWEQRD